MAAATVFGVIFVPGNGEGPGVPGGETGGKEHRHDREEKVHRQITFSLLRGVGIGNTLAALQQSTRLQRFRPASTWRCVATDGAYDT
jgi:hypothetical protein